jgi:XTP/dITP diphosphohydrolase
MSELVLATRSAHKLHEIRAILRSVPDLTVTDLEGAGVSYDPAEEHLEPYDTFEENALSKARYFFERSGRPTVADDSGLEVDALDGAPGVRSKRFSPDQHLEGEELDRANLEHLVERLGEIPLAERTARYVCVAALVTSEGEWTFRGEAPGLILGRPQGWGGFGYDPVFFDPELGKTFAQITAAEKNERSHRGKAFRVLAAHLAGG